MKKFKGKDAKRLEQIFVASAKDVYSPTSAIGYLNSIGKLMEYVMYHYNNAVWTRGTGEKFKKCEEPDVVVTSKYKNLEKIEYENETQYVGLKEEGVSDIYVVYKLLPIVEDDDLFSWKENKKYGSREAVIKEGPFEYLCVLKADDNGFVDVRYVKCDNMHRNKVTIARIEIEHANNENFKQAIREWKSEFKEEIA